MASTEYVVSLLDGVDFSPSGMVAEVLQNVRTIISTRRGSVPLDRDFGLSWEYLDRPIPVAKMLFQADVVNALSRYEPRAKVTGVDFDSDTLSSMEGVLRPSVRVRISNDQAEAVANASASFTTDETAERIAAAGGGSAGSGDVSGQTTVLMSQVSDLTARLEDIEQSDYSELYQNGES